jgi:predicted component of type VI protein secretion system
MQAILTVLRGPHQGRRIPITVAEFLIGRDPLCHLRPSSKEVHWQHCAIVSRETGIYLRDDSQRGNTYLNRRQLVGGEMELMDGDRLRIGPLEFTVSVNGEREPLSRVKLGTLLAGGPEPETRAVRSTLSLGVTARTPPPASFTVKPMKDCQEMLCSR